MPGRVPVRARMRARLQLLLYVQVQVQVQVRGGIAPRSPLAASSARTFADWPRPVSVLTSRKLAPVSR